MLIDDPIINLSEMILSKRRLLKAADKMHGANLRVAILGGYATHELIDWLKIYGSDYGLRLNVSSLGWGGVVQLLSSVTDELLVNFDVIIVLPFHDNLSLASNNKELTSIDCPILEGLKRLYDLCSQKSITVIQCDIPQSLTHGSNQDDIELSLRTFNDTNNQIYDLVHQFSNIKLCFLTQLVARIGVLNWYDRRNWTSFGDQMSIQASIYFGRNLASNLASIYLPPKKVLVLDLDNTLWGGVIGDDGFKNLHIGSDSPEGRPYYEFQQYILGLRNSGVLLALCSKNNLETAVEGFNLSGMQLKLSDFSAYRIGWEPKSKYILEISKELNLGLNSIVFVDDNPVEREEVRLSLPQISVPEVGDNVINFIDYLEECRYFYSSNSITNEDRLRAESYNQNRARDEAMNSFGNHEDFLKNLKTELIIESINDQNMQRIIQLFNKTNQFNVKTLRISPAEIDLIKEREIIYGFKVSDKFGDYGLISTLRLSLSEGTLNIINWVLSCRVFNRRVEYAVFEWLINFARNHQVDVIFAEYSPTDKNSVVAGLFVSLGFTELERGNSGHCKYSLNLKDYQFKMQHFCKVVYE